MNIAWFSQYPVSQLGAKVDWIIEKQSFHPSSWITNLARALARLPGVELHLLTICPWVKRSQVVEHEGVIIHVLKCGVPFVHRGWPAYLPFDAASGFRRESAMLSAELGRIMPDVLHAHGTENAYGLGAMRTSLPFVLSMQGILGEIHKTNPCWRYRMLIPRERQVIRRCQNFTCRTHFDTGYVRGLNPTARVFDIPEAINPLYWEGQWSSLGNRRILFLGGGAPLKGLHRLIEALGLLKNRVPDVAVDALGACAGQRKAELSSMAAQAGVEVIFHGVKTAEEIARLHRNTDLFVLASSNENSPNALAEAMVSGMPCIAFDVGGVSSMVDDGRTGLLVPPGDIEGLAAAIARVLGDRDLAGRLGAAAADVTRVRNHPEHVAKLTIEAYREILAAKVSP